MDTSLNFEPTRKKKKKKKSEKAGKGSDIFEEERRKNNPRRDLLTDFVRNAFFSFLWEKSGQAGVSYDDNAKRCELNVREASVLC